MAATTCLSIFVCHDFDKDWHCTRILYLVPRVCPESIDNREVQLERSSAANWISLSVFCYINPLAALVGDLAKISSWISLLHYSLWLNSLSLIFSEIRATATHNDKTLFSIISYNIISIVETEIYLTFISYFYKTLWPTQTEEQCI